MNRGTHAGTDLLLNFSTEIWGRGNEVSRDTLMDRHIDIKTNVEFLLMLDPSSFVSLEKECLFLPDAQCLPIRSYS